MKMKFERNFDRLFTFLGAFRNFSRIKREAIFSILFRLKILTSVKMFNLGNFLKVSNPLKSLCRMNHGKHNKKYLYKAEDKKLVNGTIIYYPR